MNNYCGNCGNKLNEGETKCLKCGFDNQSIPVKKIDEEKRDTRKGNILALVSVSFIIISIIASKVNSMYESSLFLLAVFILVYARLTYAKSKFVRILFMLFIAFLVIYLLRIVWAMLVCKGAASSCY